MRENKREYIVMTLCPFCGEMHEVPVNEADYWDWQDGALVQDAFPYLTADEREMLVSGICPNCWDKMFPEEEEEEEFEFNDDVDETGFNPYLGDYDFDC